MSLPSSLNPAAVGSSAPIHISPPAMSTSPNKPPGAIANPDLYRILNEVVPLDECEVYSWFPEPEYDPHIDAEDGESSDAGFNDDEEDEINGEHMDMDVDTPASWGQGGMELDDVNILSSVPMARTLSRSGKAERKGEDPMLQPGDEDQDEVRAGRRAGLLWSVNYFFYSK